MSYECDICGKLSVDKPSQWCSECQERELMLSIESEAKWFSESKLCQKCNHSRGPDPGDLCAVYNMPLSIVARKNKCKHFEKIDYKAAMNALKEGYY